MSHHTPPFEIHVHGDVPLRDDVDFDQVQEALKPLWKYVGARSLTDAAPSTYEEEPGIRFNPTDHVLHLCWTVEGDDDFRLAIDDTCMGLNDVAATGSHIEVSFYDVDFDDEDAGAADEARDDFVVCFVGPTPAAIMQVQRDMLVQDVVGLMERHFDASELSGVIAAVDHLFTDRFDALVNSMQLGRPPRGSGPGGHGGPPRKPRHLH